MFVNRILQPDLAFRHCKADHRRNEGFGNRPGNRLRLRTVTSVVLLEGYLVVGHHYHTRCASSFDPFADGLRLIIEVENNIKELNHLCR